MFSMRGCLMVFAMCGLLGCGVETEPTPALPDLGVVPAFELIDQHGEAVALKDLAGRLWIADFIFTRCPTTCPIQTAMMKQLQGRLESKAYWPDMRLVSFTVDPGYDRPDVLAEYAKAAGADQDHWIFVTGTRDAIWDLSNEGFKLAAGEPAEGDGPLFHSTKFVLVDALGRIRGYYDGVTEEGITELVADLDTHATSLLKK